MFIRVNIRDFLQLIAVLLLVLLGSPSRAEANLERSALPWRLGAELPISVLADPDGTLTPESVVALPETDFKPMARGFSVGFSKSTYWLRVVLPPDVRDGRERWLVLGPPFIDSIRVFEQRANGWQAHASGDTLPMSARDLNFREFVFRLKPSGDAPLFVRVASSSTVMLFGGIWEPSAFADQALPDGRNWGLFFGALALIIVLLAGFALVFRQRRFVVLLLCCLANYVMVAGLQGFHAWLLWPDSPRLASMSLGILVCLGSGMAILLLRECLDTPLHFPRLDRLYQVAGGGLLLAAASVPLGFYQWVAGWVTVVTELATLLAIVLALRLGTRGRRIQFAFAAAFLVHFLAVAPVLAINFGLLAPSRFLHTLWQYELIPHILAITGIFLIEIRKAHLRWVGQQNEALLATREAQAMLASKVAERTEALGKAHGDLQLALNSEREALFEQRKFMAMVSHEFRTPLAVIDATANNLVAVPPADDNDLLARTRQILRSTKRLVNLTDTCLADARLHDDAFRLQKATVDILVLLDEAADVAGAIARQRVRIVSECKEQPELSADPGLLRIALSNLLDNAFKYAPQGDILVTLGVLADTLLICVIDQGPGIPVADQELIFDRYQQAGQAHKGMGAGLGLSVARQIARAHGGDLRLVESSERGSSFELSLPAA